MTILKTIKNFFKFVHRKLHSIFFFNFLILFIAYTSLLVVLLSNLHVLADLETNKDEFTITEGILKPQSTGIPGDSIFKVDPLLGSSPSEYLREIRLNLSALIFSSLFDKNTENSIEKDLAESYKIGKEGKKINIRIKNDVKWHDNTTLTADDVVFTFNQVKQIQSDGVYYGAAQGGNAEIKAVNNYEVEITLDTAQASYLYELTFPILPKHILGSYPQTQIRDLPSTAFANQPIGTGMYKYERVKNNELYLIRNDNYHTDLNLPVSKHIIRIYEDYDTIATDFKLKKVDFFYDNLLTSSVPNKIIDSQSINKNNLYLLNSKIVLFFNLANDSAFNQNIGLRNALVRLIDRKELQKELNNLIRPIYGPIDQESWGYDKSIEKIHNSNRDEFHKWMKDLGYSKKDSYYQYNDKPLTLEINVQKGDLGNIIANKLSSNLEENGVKVDIKSIESNQNNVNQSETLIDLINRRGFETTITIMNEFFDPDRYDQWHSTRAEPPGLNLSSLDVTLIDNILEEGRFTQGAEREARKKLYSSFLEEFNKEVPAIYLANPSVTVFYGNKVKAIKMNEVNDIQSIYQNIDKWEFNET